MFAVSAVAQDATVNVSLEPSTKMVQVGDTFNLQLWFRSSPTGVVVHELNDLGLHWDAAYVSFDGPTSTADGAYAYSTEMCYMPGVMCIPMYWSAKAANATYTDGDAELMLAPQFAGMHGMSLPTTDQHQLTLTFTTLAMTDSTSIWLSTSDGVWAENPDAAHVMDCTGDLTGATVSIFEPIAVDIDIKFCSNPNAFNCKSRGKTPVTIFGTEDLDVTEIDISSLRLCIDGTCVESAPLAWSFADRGDPTTDLGAEECAIVEDVEQDYLNPDGYLDLDVAFDSQQIATLIDCSGLVKNDVSGTLYLTGELMDGTPIFSEPIGDPGIDQLVKKK